jgi:hypothetical protein
MAETEARYQPLPKYGLIGWVILLGGPFFSWWFGEQFQRRDGSGASWVPVGFFVAILCFGALAFVGILACRAGIRADERWPWIAYTALALNAFIFGIVALLLLAGFGGVIR